MANVSQWPNAYTNRHGVVLGLPGVFDGQHRVRLHAPERVFTARREDIPHHLLVAQEPLERQGLCPALADRASSLCRLHPKTPKLNERRHGSIASVQGSPAAIPCAVALSFLIRARRTIDAFVITIHPLYFFRPSNAEKHQMKAFPRCLFRINAVNTLQLVAKAQRNYIAFHEHNLIGSLIICRDKATIYCPTFYYSQR